MIDQLPTATPQTAQSVNTAGRDRKQASADKDEQAGNFEDIVSKAGQKQAREDDDRGAKIDPQLELGVEADRSTEARPKAAFDLSAALRGFGTPPLTQPSSQNQAQLKAVIRDAAKASGRADQSGQQTEAAQEKLSEKLKHAVKQAGKTALQAQNVSGSADIDTEQPLTPSDELGFLLGLAKDVDGKHGKKPVQAEKSEKKDDDESGSQVDELLGKTGTARVEHVAAAVDAKLASGARTSDDRSSTNDVVRLTSTNGRGRPVDIDVAPTVSGETQHDTKKSAALPKVETATVLEARRYLGFMPEPNATALATAIKADPTWAEALQATERADLGRLGNTVTEVNTLKLQMNPENLGNMVASLKLKGEELTVELRVESVEAYQQLSADHDEIVKALQDQGFSIDKVTVQLNAIDRMDPGADRDMARQGQAQRDAQPQQQPDGQGDQTGRNGGQREQQRWTPRGTTADGAAANGRNDPGRTGNLYL